MGGGQLGHGDVAGRLVGHQRVLGRLFPVVTRRKLSQVPGEWKNKIKGEWVVSDGVPRFLISLSLWEDFRIFEREFPYLCGTIFPQSLQDDFYLFVEDDGLNLCEKISLFLKDDFP